MLRIFHRADPRPNVVHGLPTLIDRDERQRTRESLVLPRIDRLLEQSGSSRDQRFKRVDSLLLVGVDD